MMLTRSFFLSCFAGLLSCTPIQLEYDLKTQSKNTFSSLEEESSPFIEINIEDFINEPEDNPKDESVNYGLNFISRLSNTLYENSSCSCNNNNDCSRGCSKQRRTCRGKKPISQPTKYCMRHITGSIMYTIDEYCKKMNRTSPKDQCLEDIEKIQKNNDSKNNICRQSLFYPSALCVLNLDGQDRITPQTIKNREVRNNCKYYNSYNSNLKYFYANFNDEIQKLPIFIEVPIESPETLPFGTIVVLQSSNPNGHVEIKTNKRLCDGSYCFCSDFCVSRKRGWKTSFKPLTAFRWNPLFINHLGQWDDENFLNLIY